MSGHKSVTVAWLHGLIDCILGHGKGIPKLLIKMFVNGMRLVIEIISSLSQNLKPHISTTLAQPAGRTGTKVLIRTRVVQSLHKRWSKFTQVYYMVHTHPLYCGHVIQVNVQNLEVAGCIWQVVSQ